MVFYHGVFPILSDFLEKVLFYTSMLGGIGMVSFVGFQRCRQFGILLTYSLFGGWYCITQSSSFQNMSLIKHMSSHVGIVPLSGQTDTCSQSMPHDHIIVALVKPVLLPLGSRIIPAPPSNAVCFMLKCLLSLTGLIPLSFHFRSAVRTIRWLYHLWIRIVILQHS